MKKELVSSFKERPTLLPRVDDETRRAVQAAFEERQGLCSFLKERELWRSRGVRRQTLDGGDSLSLSNRACRVRSPDIRRNTMDAFSEYESPFDTSAGATRETHMNETSSRSHSIFTLLVEQRKVQQKASNRHSISICVFFQAKLENIERESLDSPRVKADIWRRFMETCVLKDSPMVACARALSKSTSSPDTARAPLLCIKIQYGNLDQVDAGSRSSTAASPRCVQSSTSSISPARGPASKGGFKV